VGASGWGSATVLGYLYIGCRHEVHCYRVEETAQCFLTGSCCGPQTAGEAKVLCLGVNESGECLFAGTDNGEVWEWLIQPEGDTRCRRTFPHYDSERRSKTRPQVVAVCSTATSLFSAAGNTVWQWELASGSQLRQFCDGHTNKVSVIDVAGGYLFSGGIDQRVIQWSLDGGAVHEYVGHDKEVTDLSISPDCCSLYTVSRDFGLRHFKIGSTPSSFHIKPQYSTETGNAAVRVVALAGSHIYAGSTDGSVRRFVAENGVMELALECSSLGRTAVGGLRKGPRHIIVLHDKVYVASVHSNKSDCNLSRYDTDTDVPVAPSGRHGFRQRSPVPMARSRSPATHMKA